MLQHCVSCFCFGRSPTYLECVYLGCVCVCICITVSSGVGKCVFCSFAVGFGSFDFATEGVF